MVSENISKIIEHRRKETLLNFLIKKNFKGKLISKVVYYDTPLGEKVIIYCANPRFVFGRSNENLEKIENICKKELFFKNPQIEAIPVKNPFLDANIVADYIAFEIEKFGTKVARKKMIDVAEKVMESGAKGIEIRITGKVIGDRSQTIRYQVGNMKKSGEVNKHMSYAITYAKLPSGVIGIKVRILSDQVKVPDEIKVKDISELKPEELSNLEPEIAEKLYKLLQNMDVDNNQSQQQ